MYGFHKSFDPDKENFFTHPYFLRDFPQLLAKVQRKKGNDKKFSHKKKFCTDCMQTVIRSNKYS